MKIIYVLTIILLMVLPIVNDFEDNRIHHHSKSGDKATSDRMLEK